MKLLDFTLKELFRRKRRAFAGVLSVLLGVGIFVAARTTNKALYDKTKLQLLRFGSNIIVQSRGEPVDIYSGSINSAFLPEFYAQKIRGIKHAEMLVAVSPKLYERFQIGNQSLLIVGITQEERKAKPWWLINNEVLDTFPEGNEILMGYFAYERLGSPSHIVLGGEKFKVIGVLDKTGSPDDFMGFVALGTLQRITNKRGMVNVFEVSTSCIACKAMNVNKIAEEINSILPEDAQALPVKRIAEAQISTLTKIEQFSRIIYLVVFILSIFLLANHMSSSVSDQKRDIGMLLAMGMDSSKIYRIFLFKGLILGFLGGILGYFVGTGISMVLGPQIANTGVSPLLYLLPYSIVIALLVGIVSSILPAKRAATLDPVVALREE
jgi:putative ABC transport system permease protein